MSKLKELEKRLRDEPENLGLRVALAGAYREAHRLSDAVELYRSVAVAYRDQGRLQQAMAVCKSVLELVPDDAASRALLATLTPPAPPPAAPSPAAIRESTRAQPAKVEADVDLEIGTLVAAPVIPAPVAVPLAPRVATRESAAPKRRSSFDETPLPRAVPYHVHDPTTSVLKRLSESDLSAEDDPASDAAETRPGNEPTRPSVGGGLASAARRISASLVGSAGDADVDVAAELDTRQRVKVAAADVERLSRPPPTVPFERSDLDDPDDGPDEDAETPVPGLEHRDEDQTKPRDLPGIRQRAPTSSVLTSPFFAPLPAERRAGVLQRFQRRAVTDGTVVIHQGDVAHPLILVSRGRLDVRLHRRDESFQLGTVAMGEYIGEVALLGRTPAIANVIAAGDAEILVLPPRDFYELAQTFPALWAELKDVAERRQREYDYRLRAVR